VTILQNPVRKLTAGQGVVLNTQPDKTTAAQLSCITPFFLNKPVSSSYRVKLLVEATRIAYISTICILSPERGLCGQAIGTKNTRASTSLKQGRKRKKKTTHRKKTGQR